MKSFVEFVKFEKRKEYLNSPQRAIMESLEEMDRRIEKKEKDTELLKNNALKALRKFKLSLKNNIHRLFSATDDFSYFEYVKAKGAWDVKEQAILMDTDKAPQWLLNKFGVENTSDKYLILAGIYDCVTKNKTDGRSVECFVNLSGEKVGKIVDSDFYYNPHNKIELRKDFIPYGSSVK